MDLLCQMIGAFAPITLVAPVIATTASAADMVGTVTQSPVTQLSVATVHSVVDRSCSEWHAPGTVHAATPLQ
eukprot:COSAG01_NODE_68991_length_262_cov_1.539877_1_plen_71_part_01